MKRPLHHPLHRSLLLACAVMLSRAAFAAPTPDVVGTYVLEGQREMVASLRLERDGRFRLAMSYGAVDTDAQGRWEVAGERGDRLVLTTDAPAEPSFAWIEDQASHAERCMGGYRDPSRPPVILVACVVTPDAGLVWENMQVTAHFSNGLSRSGLTTRHGQLGFLARTEAQWQGATVDRLTVSYPRGSVPPQTFPVPPGARTVVVQFNPGRLTSPPAEQITFAVKGPRPEAAALEMLAPDGSSSGTFRRR
ncbi:MAG: hypothetical protein HZB72_08340 [Burkholderiales bacterium]|nr:hypothetical protein [Burkholderiales bacterium]